MINYSENDIIKMCDEAMKDIRAFYQKGFVNYTGISADTKREYTEIVSEYVLQHLNEFLTTIPMISRKSSYDLVHNGIYREGSGRDEEIIAVKMFNRSEKDGYSYDHIGRIIDYQIPLKSVRTDAAGKIDLLAFDGKELHILELKKPSSKETMLRCVLEGHTYLCTADKKKLLDDFRLPQDIKVSTSPFVFKGSVQWKEWNDDRPMLKKLMEKLDIKPYFIYETDEGYEVASSL